MSNLEPWFREQYPHLSEDELREAWKNFQAYCDLVLRICQRIYDDPDAYAQLKAEIKHRKRHR